MVLPISKCTLLCNAEEHFDSALRSSCSALMPMESSTRSANMGITTEDVVTIRRGSQAGDPTLISVSCPDRLGLAFDLSRSMFEFGLDIVRADFSTDGKWCLLFFWVSPRLHTLKWSALKKCLISSCPSSSLWSSFIPRVNKNQEFFLVQTCSKDRTGLLNDVIQTLWELEFDVKRLNLMVSPDGRAVNLLYIRDCGGSSTQSKRRLENVRDGIQKILADSSGVCEIRTMDADEAAEPIAEKMSWGIPDSFFGGVATDEDGNSSKLSLSIDNSLSPVHTLLQIANHDQRGLLYDCLRTLKDMHIQVAYGRLYMVQKGTRDLDFFILQEDGMKLLDPDKQKSLLAELRLAVHSPVRVTVVNKGPETELLVASLMEGNGRSRPRVLYDVTLVLKRLELSIFKADSGKVYHDGRLWEVFRCLLEEKPGSTLTSGTTRNHIMERVKNALLC